MTEWPPDLPALPAVLPRDRPVALLIRHGERPTIPAGETGADLPLTPHGRAQAEALGRALGPDLRGLHTSPVRRCRETAEAIRSGAGTSLSIALDRALGDPGIFVRDPERAWDNWRTLGHERVLEHLAWHPSPLPGLADPVLAAHALASHLLAILEASPPGLHLFVTHDAILLPTVARLSPAVSDRTWSPQYLESTALWREDAIVQIAYRSTPATSLVLHKILRSVEQ